MFWVPVIIGTRIINMLITKVKFKQWSVLHTVGNKTAGLALFSILPIYFVFGNIPAAIIDAFSAIALIASLEETGILLIARYYHVNQKSLLYHIDGKFFIGYTEHVLNGKSIGTNSVEV